MAKAEKPRKPDTTDTDGAVVNAPSSRRSGGSVTLPLGTAGEYPVPAPAEPECPVQVQVHQVDTAPALTANSHRVVEIWTQQRVYSFDAQFLCVEVIDLSSGSPEPQHPLLNSRLVGGQLCCDEGSELTFPVPTPGSEAVLQAMDGKGRMRLQVTSPVTRVILHVRRVRVGPTQSEAAWRKLTNSETDL